MMKYFCFRRQAKARLPDIVGVVVSVLLYFWCVNRFQNGGYRVMYEVVISACTLTLKYHVARTFPVTTMICKKFMQMVQWTETHYLVGRHASRVNIAVLPRSRKLSTASNDTLMFINSLLENNTVRMVCETNISTASVFARKFAPKRIYQD
jgi:hypothetical protein